MKRLKKLILNNITCVGLLLAFLITSTYCFCASEFCKKYTIRYSISTDFNGLTELKSYYTLFTNKDFNEANSQAHTINNEANKQYDGVYDVYIPYNETIFLWRFDLGNKPGKISVSELFINDKKIDNNSIDLNNLVFSPDLQLLDYQEGVFHFISKGGDPYFIINQEIPWKSFYSINNIDIVSILFLLSFLVIRDLLSQYKKLERLGKEKKNRWQHLK